MALDHELRALEGLRLEIINEDGSVGVLLGHFGGVLPSEEVVRALVRTSWVERAELKSVELSIHEGRRISLVLAFTRETSHYARVRLREVAIEVDFNLVRLIGAVRRAHAKADLFVR